MRFEEGEGAGPRGDRDEETAIGDVLSVRTSAGRNRAHLLVLAGEGLGRMFPLKQPSTTIGRATESDIRLRDDSVSRAHARIALDENELWIEDLGSANGTLVNDCLVERQALRDGDKIQIGSSTILKFRYADELEEEFQRRIYDAALRDGLTNAHNRQHFFECLPMEISYARRHNSPLSLLMIDADHFKDINDRYGHVAGDQVLVDLAQRIRGLLRGEDLLVRYGGEEFAVLCRGVGAEDALALGERLCHAVAESRFEVQGAIIPVSVSIGIAPLSDRPDPVRALVADADAALYEAKRAGRNRVVAHRFDRP